MVAVLLRGGDTGGDLDAMVDANVDRYRYIRGRVDRWMNEWMDARKCRGVLADRGVSRIALVDITVLAEYSLASSGRCWI